MNIYRILVAAVFGLLSIGAPELLAQHQEILGPTMLVFMIGDTTTAIGSGTDLDAAMKILFEDSVVNNVVSDSQLMDLFEEDNNVQQEETTGGRYIETAQYFQLPAGVGARRENEYIPVPNGPVIENSRVYLRKVQGVVEMTGDTMRRVKGNPGAYLNWANRALPDLVRRLKNELDRMALGYGNAAKARVNDATPATTLNIDSTFGVAGLTDPWLLFLEGESIVFGPNADGSSLRDSGTSAEVTDLDEDANTITIDALPTAVADNDYIFPGDDSENSSQEGGDDKEIMGLLGMVDDGSILATFQNLLRSSYRLWNAIVKDSQTGIHSGDLTEDLLDEAITDVMIRGDGETDVLVTSPSGLRSYWRSLRGDRSINDPRSEMDGGRGKLYIWVGDRRLQVRAVRKMPPELCFGLDTSTFKRWQLQGARFEWDDTTGAIWNRVTDGTGRKDAFYAVGNMYKQLGCLAPRKNFRIENLIPV